VQKTIDQELEKELVRREQAEEKLRQSEEWLRAIFDASRDGILVEDKGFIVYINNAYTRMLGYDMPEELMGTNISEILSPDDAERMSGYGAARLRGETPPTVYEFNARRKDGSLLGVEAAVSTSVVAGKTYITTAIRDITERKRVEEALRASENELLAFFAAMNDVILILNREGRFLKVAPTNPASLFMPLDEILGKTAYEIFPADTAAFLMDSVRRALDSRQPVNVEYNLNIHGDEMWFVGTASPLTEETVIFVARDVTERHRATEALRRSEEQLQQSQKMESIGTLAGGVAHDFNNLLTAILGNAQLALRKLAPDHPVHHRLIEIESAGNRATALTRQLLAFGRCQRLERKTLNLNDTIHDIMKMLRRIIGEDVEVSVRESFHLAAVFADPTQIEQILMNLAVNARDAMPGGGRLNITTRNVTLDEEYCRQHSYAVPGTYVQMIVSDTGAGMDAETRERIFEPFFTTKEVGKGTGLGLSMVYGIVKQHDGLIEVESEPEQGTTFRIYLPANGKIVKEEEPAVLPPVIGGMETILVADDDEALRELTHSVLEELGYAVLLAKDGAEAVEIYEANRERISLLLFDIMMPRMGGREAYERIRAAGSGNLDVIFMTGYSAEIVQSEFVKQNEFIEEAGAVLIQKPYSIENLGRNVRAVLDEALKCK